MRIMMSILMIVAVCGTAEARNKWQKTKEGCLIWFSDTKLPLSLSWSGKCANRKVVGNGTLTVRFKKDGKWKNRRYVGHVKAGKIKGQGVARLENGIVASGLWRNSKLHGQGEAVTRTGDRYKGQWNSGKEHGYGTYTLADGDSFTGRFRKGRPYGNGTCRSGDRKGACRMVRKKIVWLN